jgi:hypothetical protein
MPSVKQDHSAHSGDRRSSTHSRPSPKSRRGLPAVRIWSRRFRFTWVKKIMLLNYYFFNLRHSALLVLTVNDNEMTLDQIRSAKLQHVSTARLHIAFCLGTPQAWAESAAEFGGWDHYSFDLMMSTSWQKRTITRTLQHPIV